MNTDKGQFVEQMIVFSPVIGMAPGESVPPHEAGGRGKFETSIVAIPPVIGNEYLKLRLRIEIPPTGDPRTLAVALDRLIESASEMDRSLGGQGLTKLSQSDEDGAVVLVLGSVEPVGGDERIGRIAAAMNKRGGTQDAALMTAEAA